ncbi:uncharacterized protein LOC133792266 [Humulus lupulus]|uniref:uncharacterized protein LOC133792266 n=1 Tax=Humulus lupulus TaxID=3486 RepID=UPI002B40E427|nr:uncharacterized protein LOC133792266 [Humulus lupulus]
MDLTQLPLGEHVNIDGKKKGDFFKKIHEKTKENIERSTQQYIHQANKGSKKDIFEQADWMWLHVRKERLPEQRHSKFLHRGDGPFQAMEHINDNAYKIDLPGEYGVSASFNVSDLSLFDVGDDLRANQFQEGGNDANQGANGVVHNHHGRGSPRNQEDVPNDPLRLSSGPITRLRAKRFKDALIGLIQK